MTLKRKIILSAFILCGILIPMADPVWWMLQKSLSDIQTIAQAIAAAITAHNDDPDAHLGVGQSLQSHRASEIIDHEAQSIVADKFSSSNSGIFVPVNGDLTAEAGNYTAIIPGVIAVIQQGTGHTGEAYTTLWDIIPSDCGYNDGDVVVDVVFQGTGVSGAWYAKFMVEFAYIEVTSSGVRFAYYDGTYHLSSFFSIATAAVLPYRIHVDRAAGLIRFYAGGVELYNHAYTYSLDGFEVITNIAVARSTGSFATAGFGNIYLAFDGAF